MDIYYWTDWQKKKNSTRQPATGTKAVVKLLEPCSLYAPKIEASGIPRNANYFMIPKGIANAQIDYYYFLTDMVSVTADITQFFLELDPMATFKAEIQATGAYVERANSAAYNPWIQDPMNQPSDSVTIQAASTNLHYVVGQTTYTLFDPDNMRYVLSVIGIPSGNPRMVNGIATNYLLSDYTMLLVALDLNSNNFLTNLQQELNNPLDSIIGCKAMPVNYSGASRQQETVTFGSNSTSVTAEVFTNRSITCDNTLTLPTIMTGAQDYTHVSPYVTATIYLPFVGVCPLDVDQLTGRTVILRTSVDLCTGDLIYAIIAGGTTVQTFSGNCSSEVPVTGGYYSAIGRAGGVLTTIGGIAAGNPAVAVAGALATAKSMQVHSQMNGSYSSSIGGNVGTAVLVTAYVRSPAHPVGNDSVSDGLPYEKHENVLSVFSGYVKCRGASVDINGRAQDKETINGYLNGGFYME